MTDIVARLRWAAEQADAHALHLLFLGDGGLLDDALAKIERQAETISRLADACASQVALIADKDMQHEECVQMVLSASLATGHADTPQDLIAEVLRQVEALRTLCNEMRRDAAG